MSQQSEPCIMCNDGGWGGGCGICGKRGTPREEAIASMGVRIEAFARKPGKPWAEDPDGWWHTMADRMAEEFFELVEDTLR